jgi:large-conductance mechanosensitive channel
MVNNISDKDILYSMVRREISNLLQGIPIFAAFEGTISSLVIQWIDPYISAFIGDDNQINTEQLSDFVSEEVTNKIKDFKERYAQRRGKADEN